VDTYDPFARGPFPAGVRTLDAVDRSRRRRFPIEVWYPAAPSHAGQDLAEATQDVVDVPPRAAWRQRAVRDAAAQPGTCPLVVFSHGSGYHRRAATFLCTHLASHGYAVGALDHSEIVAPELARRDGETAEARAARVEGWVAGRVPDIRFLLDHMLDTDAWDSEARLDLGRVAIVGHSFGGWTALAATAVEWRIRAVVALAPGGNSKPRPGIIHAPLSFRWGRDVPTLYLAAEYDTPIPLPAMYELFERTPATKRMVILRRADHGHFIDNVEQEHEAVRAMTFPPDLAWITQEMRPIAELCSGEQAHTFVRALALAHMDAVLRGREDARRFLAGDVAAALAARGVDVIVHAP